MDKLKEWGDQHPVIAWVLALTIIFGGLFIIATSTDANFMFRHDKFPIPALQSELQFFIIIAVIATIWSFFPNKYLSLALAIPFITFVLFCLFKVFLISQLKHSDTPFITTYAGVSNYRSVSTGRGSESEYYTLSFHNKMPINNHNLEITWSKNHAISRPNEGDCVKMKYRENAWLIEFHFIENLGKMSVNECWETAR